MGGGGEEVGVRVKVKGEGGKGYVSQICGHCKIPWTAA